MVFSFEWLKMKKWFYMCVLQTYWGKRSSQGVRTRSGCCTSDPEPPEPEEIQTLVEECSTCSSYKTIEHHFNQINRFKHKHPLTDTHLYNTRQFLTQGNPLKIHSRPTQRQAVCTDPSHWLWLIFETQHRFITAQKIYWRL